MLHRRHLWIIARSMGVRLINESSSTEIRQGKFVKTSTESIEPGALTAVNGQSFTATERRECVAICVVIARRPSSCSGGARKWGERVPPARSATDNDTIGKK